MYSRTRSCRGRDSAPLRAAARWRPWPAPGPRPRAGQGAMGSRARQSLRQPLLPHGGPSGYLMLLTRLRFPLGNAREGVYNNNSNNNDNNNNKRYEVWALEHCDCKLIVSSANGMWYMERRACDVWLRQGTKWVLRHGASVAEFFSPVFVSHWILL